MDSKNMTIYNASKWTFEEDQALLDELISGFPIHTIAKLHGKSQESINQRRKALAYKLYKKRVPLKKISEMTRLKTDEIRTFISKRQEYIAEKKKCF